jgi:hypothetical protein
MEAYKAEMAQLERARAEKAKLEAETIVPTLY